MYVIGPSIRLVSSLVGKPLRHACGGCSRRRSMVALAAVCILLLVDAPLKGLMRQVVSPLLGMASIVFNAFEHEQISRTFHDPLGGVGPRPRGHRRDHDHVNAMSQRELRGDCYICK